jgi:hypothetical protein
MKNTIRNYLVSILASFLICLIAILLVRPLVVSGEEYPGQGKDQLVDALDAAIARVLDGGQWRAIINSDPIVAPLVVNIADCYPRITEGDPGEEVEIYPFPQSPTGLLADILSSKQIRVGSYRVDETPGTFHIFDDVNPLLLRAVIDELGNGYDIPPSPDPAAIQIVHVDVYPPSSSLLFTMLNDGDFDITNFNAALGATANEKRRRKLARFTCTIFGTSWYIHVKDSSSYQTMDDVLADTTADLCVGQLSSRLSEDYFKNAQSIDKQFAEDDLVVCSEGVSDGTYDAYLHFDPVPYLPDLRAIPMGIVSGIPIWVAGDTSTSVMSTTTTSTTHPCSLKEIYGENSEETELLRSFRKNVLSKTSEGREIIRLYYEWSPVIVKAMEEDEEFKKEVKKFFDTIVPLIKNAL